MNTLKIFVSHNHQDRVFCHALVQALLNAGADAWYDEHNLGSGPLRAAIEQELRRRQIFLLILTPAALASLWVREETEWFYDLYRQELRKPGTSHQLLPVLLESVKEEDMPLFLRGFKRIAYPNGKPYPQAEAIQRTLKALELIPTTTTTPQPGQGSQPPLQASMPSSQGLLQPASLVKSATPASLRPAPNIKKRFLISLAINGFLFISIMTIIISIIKLIRKR